jgi:hypothetical protein
MAEDSELCEALTAILIAHPDLVSGAASAYAMLELDPEIASVREAILRWARTADGDLVAALKAAGIVDEEISSLSQHMPLAVRERVLKPDGRGVAETVWWQILSCMRVDILASELIIADHDYRTDASESNKRRLAMLTSVMNYVADLESQEARNPPLVPADPAISPDELEDMAKRTSELREVIVRAIATYKASEMSNVVIGALGAATAQVALMARDPEQFVWHVYQSAVQFLQIQKRRQMDDDLLREKAAAGVVH